MQIYSKSNILDCKKQIIMKGKVMKITKMAKANEIKRDWIVLDAEGKTFGRLITEIATLLRGKHKPSYTPNVDCGDFVVVSMRQK